MALARRPTPDPCRRGRAGSILPYVVVTLIALTAVCSLAVDYARVQLVKSELQRCTDAAARGYMEYYQLYGQSYADSAGPQLYAAANNPVDGASGVAPTVTVEWGNWTESNKTFHPTSATPTAVRVTASRKAAAGNGVPLAWGRLLGRATCDVSTTSTAALIGAQSASVTVSATANPYLAGMPAGTTNLGGDDFGDAAPYEVTGVPINPGSYISLTGVAGTTCVLPGYVANSGPNGIASIPVHHGQNYNKTIDLAGPENGIADAIMPESMVFGLFLDDNPPTTGATPATLDWSAASARDLPTYSTLALKQPFPIGDGKTSGGATQQFQVPPGATRLFIGIWDGIGYYNNTGSFSATISSTAVVTLVQ
jgi:hypothetical protein